MFQIEAIELLENDCRDSIEKKDKEIKSLNSTISQQNSIESMVDAYRNSIKENEEKIDAGEKFIKIYDVGGKVGYGEFYYDSSKEQKKYCYPVLGTYWYQEVQIVLDIPFLEYETSSKDGGFYGMLGVKEKGTISGFYYCRDKEKADGVISVYVKSCDKHKEEIVSRKEMMRKCKVDNDVLKEKLSVIEKQATPDEQKEVIRGLLDAASAKIKDLVKSQEKLLNEIEKERALYNLVLACEDIIEEEGSTAKFCCNYFDFCSSLPMKNQNDFNENEEKKEE